MVPVRNALFVRFVVPVCLWTGSLVGSAEGIASNEVPLHDLLAHMGESGATSRTAYVSAVIQPETPAAGSEGDATYDLPSLTGLLDLMGKADTSRSKPIRGSKRVLRVPLISVEAPVPASGIPPPRIAVDGNLDDALWRKAAASSNFWCSLENRAPDDPSVVLAARDAFYLYFGFRLYDRDPSSIQSTATVRDVGLGYDDSISVQLDTFLSRRDISEFSLNAIGTQSDQFSGGRSKKVEWKGDWLGSAKRTDYGWSAEFAIPFSVLNYSVDDTSFGVNFRRYQSRTKQFSYWADVTPRGLMEEMGRLEGLVLADSGRGRVWTFMPFVLAGANIPDKEGEIQDNLITAGIDIRYQPRPDTTGMLSVNPDFSQVEDAVTDISFSYSEKRRADNRPFFIEGRDYFASPKDGSEYFYSNRAADFDVGGKAFGRVGKTQYGVLATMAPDDRYDGVARLLYEFDSTHSGIASVTATHQADFDNALAAAMFRGRQPSGLEYALDAAATGTQTNNGSVQVDGGGNHFKGMLGWRADYWYLRGEGDRYDRNYFPALGLLDVDLPGTQSGTATAGYYREQSDRFWSVINTYTGFKYRETIEAQLLQNRKWFAGGSVEFENQIRTTFYAEEGPYRPVTAVRGVFENFTYEDRYYSTAVDFNTRSSLYSFGPRYDWGRLGGSDYEYYSVYGWWRPVNSLYVNLSAEHTDSYGYYDQVVLTGSWNITPEHTLGGRYIYTDDIDYYRLAYSFKPRKGWDIFAVYDDHSSSAKEGEYSLKVVKTF